MQFCIAICIIEAYFFMMFIFARQFISNTEIITNEINVSSQAESYFSFAQNAQREMIYDSQKPVLNEDSFTIAKDTIEMLYGLNSDILDHHFKNRKILDGEYKSEFKSLMRGDLC